MTQPDGFHLFPRIAHIDARQWDALVDASSASATPCVRHAFLHALEESGSVGGRSGWTPVHATLWHEGGLRAAMPLYLKAHSRGEYVFDWAWAEAYQRHGLDYYPKWLAAVPFTPIPGPRLLGHDDVARRELLTALLAQARESGLSSLHLLFPLEHERPLLEAAGLMIREGVQFHWENPPGYAETAPTPSESSMSPSEPQRWNDFEDFLASLSGPKRKKIRQERRRAAAHGLALQWLDGHEARDEDWAFFAHCYANTYVQHRSTPYLASEFFVRIARSMPDAVRLLVAHRGSRPIAAAFFLCNRDALYGRYWGCVEDLPFLHFELCYYQAIEYCLEHGLTRFEGGAQGEHKLARGLLPVRTFSAHWLADPRFRSAVDDWLARERAGVGHYLDELAEHSPFRRNTEGTTSAGLAKGVNAEREARTQAMNASPGGSRVSVPASAAVYAARRGNRR